MFSIWVENDVDPSQMVSLDVFKKDQSGWTIPSLLYQIRKPEKSWASYVKWLNSISMQLSVTYHLIRLRQNNLQRKKCHILWLFDNR